MGTIRRFEDIEAWKTARVSSEGQFSRDFGLKDQMRRAAVSVMSNIAEGFESRTPKLFVNYLGIAKASAGELRSQAYIALDAGHINQADFKQLFDLVEKCSCQLSRFMTYLQSSNR